jgi:hypothetical protein
MVLLCFSNLQIDPNILIAIDLDKVTSTCMNQVLIMIILKHDLVVLCFCSFKITHSFDINFNSTFAFLLATFFFVVFIYYFDTFI